MLRPALVETCPLKKETAEQGIDLIICRELTGGVYFGKRDRYETEDRGTEATDLMAYSEMEIERIGRRAFELARLRRKKVTSVDKANVLATSRLWREVMHRLAAEYPDVEYEDMLVDNTAMQLVKHPSQFDVVVTENMFGDILSDEASMLPVLWGCYLPASLGETAPACTSPAIRQRTQICWAGQGKSHRHHPLCVHDVPLFPEPAGGIQSHRGRCGCSPGGRLAHLRHPGDGELVGTKKMGQLIREHL